jgi:hypothetical protein
MNEPFTIRISDSEDPERADKFKTVLHKRGANPTDILRRLIEAYVASDGAVPFPVKLVSAGKAVAPVIHLDVLSRRQS